MLSSRKEYKISSAGPSSPRRSLSGDSEYHCTDHKQKVCELFCNTCVAPVCSYCKESKHKSHTSVLLKQKLESEKQHFANKIVSTETYVSELKATLSKRRNHHEHYGKSISNTKSMISHQIQIVKSELDNLQGDLLREISNSIENENKEYIIDRMELENEILQLEKLNDLMKNTRITVGTLHKLPQISTEVQTVVDKSKQTQQSCENCSQAPDFVSGDRQRSSLLKVVGKVELPTAVKNRNSGDLKNVIRAGKSTKLTLVNSFQCPLPTAIRSVCPVDREEAWIAQNQEKTLSLVKKNGKVTRTVMLDFFPDDMVRTKSGNLLLTAFDGSFIHKVTMTASQISNNEIANFSPDSTRGICINNDQDVLVCIISEDANRNSQIVRLSDTGDILQRIEHNDAMFYWPSRVACHEQGAITILDWELGSNKCVSLDREGNYVCTWKGEISDKKPKKFSPCGLAAYKNGQIFVADSKNDQVYLLQGDGKTAECMFEPPHSLKDPFGIALDVDGYLWIGCGDGNIHIAALKTGKNRSNITHF